MNLDLLLSAFLMHGLALLLGALMLLMVLPKFEVAKAIHPALFFGLAVLLGQAGVAFSLWLSATRADGGVLNASAAVRQVVFVTIVLFLVCLKKNWQQWPKPHFKKPVFNALIAALVALILAHITLHWHELLLRPSYGADTTSLWGLRAKLLHQGVSLNAPEVIANNYPLFISLLRLWPNLGQAEYREILPNLSWGIAYLGLLSTLYGGLRQLGSQTLMATVATYALASVPLLGTHVALSGYADFHVAYAVLSALICLTLALRERRLAWVVLFLIAVVIVAKLKRPTIYWALLLLASSWVGASQFIRPKRWWQISIGLGIASLLLLFLTADKLASYYQHFLDVKRFNIMPEMFFENLLVTSSYNVLWCVFGLMLAYAWRSLGDVTVRAVAFFVLGAMLVILLTVGFTSTSPYWAVQTVVNRTLLHFVPSMVLLLALLWQAKQGAKV